MKFFGNFAIRQSVSIQDQRYDIARVMTRPQRLQHITLATYVRMYPE